MEENKTSVFSNGLIWFGAGVSMSEILTGTYFAPLGIKTGLFAILIGHIIGGILLFLAGYLGAKTRNNAMETVAVSFGRKGNLPFSVLNILQLAGWLAILNYDGALAANGIFSVGAGVWCAVIGILLLLWVLVGLKRLEKINMVAMTALFLMTLVLCFVIVTRGNFGTLFNGSSANKDALTFGAAIELSAAMPLSWIPVISDYTSNSTKPVKATVVSTIVYCLVSCWMYLIGMSAAIGMGTPDIAQISLRAGLGVVGLLIILFSTVTTNFLAAHSAGVSGEVIGESFSKHINGKYLSVLVVLIGTIAAILYPMDNIEDFLYLINSVFAPMIAVMIADFFFNKKRSVTKEWDWTNLIVWLIGLSLYRVLMHVDIVIGYTLPDIVITAVLCVIVHRILPKNRLDKAL
ncbi:Permease for cytosine/purines, uracil, thiamine, allantoin [Anaerobutyricum hallii]|uniref:Permease for cytosine/purines, uracil, thiamine, allantoin n=1 Tax=Anaerobutyricum hallii TaxID=39488 RepID=A0A285PVF4_9FIRM|nr:putative hydroxymethylpyrimidine transporter CytX [Anaerobutyricum hallii]SOB71995.1 Permease for cytosine/purines, uracil, thiamine, allantoin [Anaerobutyricum hallii]